MPIMSDEEKTTILEYLIHALDAPEETMSEIAKGLVSEELMPSLAERLIKRGKMEGKLEGKIEGKQTTLIR